MSSALQQIGNYRLLKHLGSGGQASVYLGEHLFLKRRSAIKILHTSLDEQNSALFLREAQILASLNHPHIIRIHDFTIEHGEPLLAMDYAPGGTLRACYPTGQPFPLEMLLTYLQQIASALQYAHDRGIIHRDIKPENLLLDESQQIRLSDFGLALLAPSPEQLQTQELIGTVFYMAPEQLRGKPGFASDQYALGILLYEWLCGERPFQGTSIEMIGQHLSAEMPPLRLKRPDLPQEVDAVLRRALAKDPRQRFNSVLEFAQAFEHACHADLPVSPGQQPRLTAPAAVPSPYATVSVSEQTVRVGQRQQQQQIHKLPNPAPVLEPSRQQQREHANRQRMLAKVRSFWIDGVLEQSLRDVAHLVLGLREEPGAVARPWELILRQTDTARRPLPAGTSIIEVYDKVGGELLILGNPGSGKTTLLLELARDLLKRAEDGQLDVLPVVFNLSSWTEKSLPLKDWLVEELNRKYQVPRKLARAWVEQDQILPLLDGLDEMAAGAQSACVEAINAYRNEHGLLPLVICCRTGDYFAQHRRVQLDSSVEIQPLTSSQIEDYLAAFGQQFEPVRVALQHDPELRELISTPLMLNILVLAYQDQPLADLLSADTLDLRQRRLFETYVQRVLERRGGRAPYTLEQTTRWLSWLAKSMRRHDQSVFYLERLQPSALSTQRQQNFYHTWAVRLPGMLMGGLIGVWISSLLVINFLAPGYAAAPAYFDTILLSGCFGLFLGFLLTRRQKTPRRSLPVWVGHVRPGLLLGTCSWLLVWLFSVLGPLGRAMLNSPLFFLIGLGYLPSVWLPYVLIGFLTSLLITRTSAGERDIREGRGPFRSLWRSLTGRSSLRNALIGVLPGLIFGLVNTLIYGLIRPSFLGSGVVIGYILGQTLNLSAISGIMSLLASLFIRRAGTEEIQPTEHITWSWDSLLGSFLKLKHLGYALLISLCYTTLYGMFSFMLSFAFGLYPLGLWGISVFSIFGMVALVSWLLITLFGGWSGEMLDEHKLTTPNQGIRRSSFYGLLFGLVSWLIYGGITWLIRSLASFIPFAPLVIQDTWLRSWFFYSLPGALVIGLLVGGWASLKHALLRWQLRKSDAMPRLYTHFLDYAAERILLRKVGGGYLFIHRLLLDYFASLENDEQKD